ncbi:hypothetical protein MOD25_05900 [Bacillus haynesii]|uniref:hypothetical protein n=1 Tax=Bacillus haynesii TaxID=1925021 RepID=UPI00227E09D0|nr:hypothetical protein [Bacillus haynesii]MCY8549436.1 hypothetical protein [Bacillus haynesii]
MKVKISILYNSGIKEEAVQELREEEFENIAKIIDSAFKEGVSAIIRLNNAEEFMFISLSQVARVSFKEIESE